MNNTPESLEAVAKLLEIANTHTLARHVYQDNTGSCCIIGHFLTPDELHWLSNNPDENLMEVGVERLVEGCGFPLEKRIGLPLEDLNKIQRLNDSYDYDLKAELQAVLGGEIDKWNRTSFINVDMGKEP